jgi:hypothetical protein
MKRILFGITALGLIQTAGILSAKADGDGLRFVTNAINADGTTQIPTNTFTSSRLGTGHYLITFAPWVFGQTLPLCIVMPVGGNTVGGERVHVSDCDIQIFDTSGNAKDSIFGFTASRITGTVNTR